MVNFLLERAMSAIDGTDPKITALIGRHFLMKALSSGAPKELLARWLFTVNSTADKLTITQLETMYFESLANALKLNDADARAAIQEAKAAL